MEGAAVVAAVAAAADDGGDSLAQPPAVSMLSPTVWSPPSSPICSPVKRVPPRRGGVMVAVPFGCAPGRGGDTSLTATAASADRCCSLPPRLPRPLGAPVAAAGAMSAFGDVPPSDARVAATTTHAAGVREQVVAAAAAEGWVDLDGEELEGVLAEVEAALAEEAAAEEAARVDAYVSGVDEWGERAPVILAAATDMMDGVHTTGFADTSSTTAAAAADTADADNGSDTDLDELIAWQARMTLCDTPAATGSAAVDESALCPVLCPVCEASVLAPWPVGRGVTCAAGCGVHAPIGDWGGDVGVLAAARSHLADVLATHAESGCGERLLGVSCGQGGGGVLLGCGVCGVWERVL